MYYENSRGATILPAKSVKVWFNSIFSMAFYVGLFSGIGYILQLTLF
jgi:hypothetical protein